MKLFFNVGEKFLNFPDEFFDQSKTLPELYEHMTGRCKDNVLERVKKLIGSIRSSKQLVVDTYNCILQNKWLFCHVYFKTCLPKGSELVESMPCQEEVNFARLKPICSYVLGNFSHTMFLAYKLCPEVFSGSNYSAFIHEDVKNIQNCQKKSQKWINESSTEHCYVNSGESYNGTVSTTLSNKTCEQWNLNTVLNNITYPNLVENYCRNPQSYASQPWCFTNYAKREWEYCNISRCEIKNYKRGEEKLTNPIYYLTITTTMLMLIIICVVVAVAVAVAKQSSKQKKNGKEEIIPYSVTMLSEATNIVNSIYTPESEQVKK